MQIYSAELLAKTKKPARFAPGTDLRQFMRIVSSQERATTVQIDSSDFATAWYTRQRYEVNAGRLEVPTLYEPIYTIVNDPTFPKNVSVNVLGPGGVIIDEITEGGEVHFVSITESTRSIQIKHYAIGLEYDKDLIMFNELWNVGLIERAVGKAWNALLNHVHLSPIITAVYPAANLTPANTTGTLLEEKVLHTLEDAIEAMSTDTVNPRPGPYIILTSPMNRFLLERVLTRVPQFGISIQTSAIDMIQSIISYQGWTGYRGKKQVSYAGAPSGYMFLIDAGSRDFAFKSYVKQDLQSQQGEADMTRFILEQVIWDTYFGVYSNAPYAVQKVTLPT